MQRHRGCPAKGQQKPTTLLFFINTWGYLFSLSNTVQLEAPGISSSFQHTGTALNVSLFSRERTVLLFFSKWGSVSLGQTSYQIYLKFKAVVYITGTRVLFSTTPENGRRYKLLFIPPSLSLPHASSHFFPFFSPSLSSWTYVCPMIHGFWPGAATVQLYVEHSIYSSRHYLPRDYATLSYPTTHLRVKIINMLLICTFSFACVMNI